MDVENNKKRPDVDNHLQLLFYPPPPAGVAAGLVVQFKPGLTPPMSPRALPF